MPAVLRSLSLSRLNTPPQTSANYDERFTSTSARACVSRRARPAGNPIDGRRDTCIAALEQAIERAIPVHPCTSSQVTYIAGQLHQLGVTAENVAQLMRTHRWADTLVGACSYASRTLFTHGLRNVIQQTFVGYGGIAGPALGTVCGAFWAAYMSRILDQVFPDTRPFSASLRFDLTCMLDGLFAKIDRFDQGSDHAFLDVLRDATGEAIKNSAMAGVMGGAFRWINWESRSTVEQLQCTRRRASVPLALLDSMKKNCHQIKNDMHLRLMCPDRETAERFILLIPEMLANIFFGYVEAPDEIKRTVTAAAETTMLWRGAAIKTYETYRQWRGVSYPLDMGSPESGLPSTSDTGIRQRRIGRSLSAATLT